MVVTNHRGATRLARPVDPKEKDPMRALSRRDALVLGAGSAALAWIATGRPSAATAEEAEAAIMAFTGGKRPEKGRIAIDLPEIAENGSTVPLSVAVDSPMTAESHVTDVLLVADGNPRPGIATFRFTPMSGRAEAATRIRLAATQNVIVIAKMSDGTLYADQKEVKVTIGGCGG